jgi:hypothetical protein
MELDVTDKLDKEFINLVLEIEKRYVDLSKQERLRIESWIKKLCVITTNTDWKKNRNMHAIIILDMLLGGHFEPPYNKIFIHSDELPLLSKTVVK